MYMMMATTLALFDIQPPKDDFENPIAVNPKLKLGNPPCVFYTLERRSHLILTYTRHFEKFDCVIKPRNEQCERMIRSLGVTTNA